MPITGSDFKPAWWLPGPHLQTIGAKLFRSAPAISLIKERLELADGDFIDLAWSENRNDPIVLIQHGLEGSLKSHYAKGLIHSLSAAGFTCCFIHFRGCSGQVNRLARSYHSGETGDLQQVIDHIQLKYNQNIFAVIGFSLGGNSLLKWLGEQGQNSPVKTAVAISVPFQLADAAQRMEQGFSRLYQTHLIKSLQKKYREKFATMSSPLDIEIEQLSTFFEFDDQVTAPLHGFDGAKDYYARSSSRQYLTSIKTPTLILHAKDDPFMWPETVPEENQISSDVTLELADQGGHVGFVSGSFPWQPEYWLDKRITQWLLMN